MTTAARAAEAFNRDGKWTARAVEHNLAVEVRHVDSGDLAATVWLPADDTGEVWAWGTPLALDYQERPASIGLRALVKAVTESLPAGAK